jgi:cathepsin L
MNVFIALCVLLVGAYCAPMLNKQLDDEWESFKNVHKKQYNSVAEESARRTIWQANSATIVQHNSEAALGIHTYTLGMNEYGDLTTEEFTKQMNGLKQPTKAKNRALQKSLAPSPSATPAAVDWRLAGYVTPVKNQGQCGSCWAFSATGSLEGQHFAKTKQLVSLSEQNLVDCSTSYGNQGCNGGWTDYAFEYIQANRGVDTEASYPYTAAQGRCRFSKNSNGATDTTYVDIQSGSESALQAAVATIGPISVAIDASHSSFQLYKSGVYNETACSSTSLDHAVLVVGYNTTSSVVPYYIVKNSWGTTWGIQGYIWMSLNNGNQCGIATAASYPLV